jgi:hypothetical protein
VSICRSIRIAADLLERLGRAANFTPFVAESSSNLAEPRGLLQCLADSLPHGCDLQYRGGATMTFPAQLKLDTIIGEDFKILRRIGEGGMGVVYAAIQLTTGHERAVKIMHSPFALDVRARERFEQEARIGARIHSDHVVQVVAAGVDETSRTPWMAMELLSGQDLERFLKTRGPLPLADSAVVIGQFMHALAAGGLSAGAACCAAPPGAESRVARVSINRSLTRAFP